MINSPQAQIPKFYDAGTNAYYENVPSKSIPLIQNFVSPIDGAIYIVTVDNTSGASNMCHVTRTSFGNDYMPTSQRISIPIVRPKKKKRAITL